MKLFPATLVRQSKKISYGFYLLYSCMHNKNDDVDILRFSCVKWKVALGERFTSVFIHFRDLVKNHIPLGSILLKAYIYRVQEKLSSIG